MAVTAYYSTDASAPTLSGTAGDLINVLDACLVNGYGAKAAAGWAKSFSGANKAAYRPPAGNQLYLRISDEGTGSAQYARAIGYETMSDVDTGTGPFPTTAQVSGGLYFHKSSGANATTRPWVLVADDKFFMIFIDANSDGINGIGHCFGSFYSYKTSDNYNTIIIGGSSTSYTTNYIMEVVKCTGVNNTAGHYMARRYDGLSTSIAFGKSPISGFGWQTNSAAYSGNTAHFPLKYPDPITGSLMMSGLYVVENALDNVIRGRIPGLWMVCHGLPLTHMDTITGVVGSDLEGKTFLYFLTALAATKGAVLIEISNTWYDVNFQ